MGIKICPKCSAHNNEHANFCRRCGTKLGDIPASYRPGAGVGGPKGETMVDPNLAGPSPVVPLDNQQFQAAPQPLARGIPKGRTVVDSARPEAAAGRGRKLVGFLVTYDLDPAHHGTFFPLYQGRTLLGAYVNPEGNIVIDRNLDPAISEKHCVLLFRNGRLWIADEMSSNGTWVDVNTANRTAHPELYEGKGAAVIKSAEFNGREVSLICIEDSKVQLADGSIVMVGNTVFIVKLVS